MAVPLIRQLASRIVELQAEPLSDALIAKRNNALLIFWRRHLPGRIPVRSGPWLARRRRGGEAIVR